MITSRSLLYSSRLNNSEPILTGYAVQQSTQYKHSPINKLQRNPALLPPSLAVSPSSCTNCIACRPPLQASTQQPSTPPRTCPRVTVRPPVQASDKAGKNISDSRLLASPFPPPHHNLPAKLVSPRNAPPSVYPQLHLGHQATLINLLPHCTRVKSRAPPFPLLELASFKHKFPTSLNNIPHASSSINQPPQCLLPPPTWRRAPMPPLTT